MNIVKTAAAATLLGGTTLGIGCLGAPGPMIGLWDGLHSRIGWTSATCTSAPVACLDDRTGALRRHQAEVREVRTQAEIGLRSLDTEESRVRNLLDANLGQQALLRSRANDAAQRGADRVTFLGRAYSMGEVAAQAASLVAEQQQFEGTLGTLLPPRREALLKARQRSMLADNSVTTTLATVDADRALLLAGRSMDRTSRLLAEIAGTEQQATEVLGVVRSTLELAAADRSTKPVAPSAAAETFDFIAWSNGRSSQGG